ncbi:hypothetical protein [Streptomyces telluris]|uniref:Uncharacterized protein n=1 Tax=Streptomyces telluris TaxID=2720021 RepID=A0A9X2LPL4_9ACTN|nr:hypothetical protein [Streptomyces telluris]MCQ8775053.1 hypothetical protein [Streptomyces telluris]NJP82901.1 hypothetical protein [Streptomyces telluris]
MDTKKIALLLALAGMVFIWSMAMAAMGHVTLIASLAPALGLTVTQVLRGFRSRTAQALGHRGTAGPDQEDDAP